MTNEILKDEQLDEIAGGSEETLKTSDDEKINRDYVIPYLTDALRQINLQIERKGQQQ